MNRRDWIAGTAGAMVALGATAQSVRKPWPGRKATPALQLNGIDGTPWRLADERGHLLLLNFWASWCEPCRAEMPSLEKLAASQAGSGLRVVAVNFKEGEPAIRRFLSKTSLQLPVVRDADGAAARAFGINIFPSTVVIDRRGHASFILVGEFDWAGEEAAAMLRSLLRAEAAPTHATIAA
ncbi:MAG: TlpA disulfide reductase family protein [Ottowia sp.]|uniref:TlpA family protein disulfide reductase n=1 Tax=Ottowia sp. TaxID=1898956 RepID=UPI003C711818